MGKPRLRASVVCEAEGHLLLVRLRDPTTRAVHLYPPGGGIEPGESPARTAERETLEETGLHVRVEPSLELVDEYPFTWDGVDYDCTTHYLAATLTDRFDPALAPVEDAAYNEGAAWLPTEEALTTLEAHPRIATAVSRLLGRMRRADWRRDPRFLGHAQMLLVIHDQFRLSSERLRFVLEREPDVDLGWLARMFRPLAEMLHHHHHAEEILLFPQMGGAERLTRDHEALKAAIAQVSGALRSGGSPEDAAAVLRRFDDILVDHLDREEALAMPFLLAGVSGEGHRA